MKLFPAPKISMTHSSPVTFHFNRTPFINQYFFVYLKNVCFATDPKLSPIIAESVIENLNVSPVIGSKNLKFYKDLTKSASTVDQTNLTGFYSIDTWSKIGKNEGLDIIAFGSVIGENLQSIKIFVFAPWFSPTDRIFELKSITVDEPVKSGSITDGNFMENLKISVKVNTENWVEIEIETVDKVYQCDTSGSDT